MADRTADYRVALVTNIAAPYRLTTWAALAERVKALHVFLCAETEPNRVWEIEGLAEAPFTTTVVPGRHFYLRRRDWAVHWNPAIIRELRSFRPTHVILTGYDAPSYWLLMYFAHRHEIPLTLWWESHQRSGSSRGRLMNSIRRLIARNTDSFITAGTLATRHVRSLGVPPDRIVTERTRSM